MFIFSLNLDKLTDTDISNEKKLVKCGVTMMSEPTHKMCT